jgi:1-deoxy-D-xylulose-5-phosphate synthase
VKRELTGLPRLGRSTYSVLHAVKEGLKDALSPQTLFGDLGIRYLGPIDGHDIFALEKALRMAKGVDGPVIVHTVTRKGMGYRPAEEDPADRMHACGPIDRRTGKPKADTDVTQWTDVFACELLRWGSRRDDVVAITAAMPGPTGLAAFGKQFPNRMFDVGIAEQHAVTSAAGLALGGMHPVVAIYSTFLNRAFDQVMMDVALLKLPVTFVLDRAGITGPDGASHNGMWDLSLLGMVPGMRVAAPRDAASLREQLGEALGVDDAPTAIRFPKGAVVAHTEAVERIEGVDMLCRPHDPDVLLIAVGPLASVALRAAATLAKRGVAVAVVDPRWVLPVPEQVVKFAGSVRLVVTLEESGLHGGVGSAVAARMREARIDTPVRSVGVPQRFLAQAARSAIHADLGLTAADLVTNISFWVKRAADLNVNRDE